VLRRAAQGGDRAGELARVEGIEGVQAGHGLVSHGSTRSDRSTRNSTSRG
jgi:hypothetical protein